VLEVRQPLSACPWPVETHPDGALRQPVTARHSRCTPGSSRRPWWPLYVNVFGLRLLLIDPDEVAIVSYHPDNGRSNRAIEPSHPVVDVVAGPKSPPVLVRHGDLPCPTSDFLALGLQVLD
jgi:hypothetical protein